MWKHLETAIKHTYLETGSTECTVSRKKKASLEVQAQGEEEYKEGHAIFVGSRKISGLNLIVTIILRKKTQNIVMTVEERAPNVPEFSY